MSAIQAQEVLTQPKGNTVRQPELTSLIGIRDGAGDRLVLVRVDRADGTRGYMLKVGPGNVFLTAGDLAGLSTVIRFELLSANRLRLLARTLWLLVLCAVVWLLTFAVTGPLFAYPWSN
jgi:hypothetical protein